MNPGRRVFLESGFWYEHDRGFLWFSGGIVPRSKYTEFLADSGLVEAFAESKMTSAKTFVRERHHNKFIAHQVIKRMEK